MSRDNKFKHDLTNLGKTNMLNFKKGLTFFKKPTTSMVNLTSENNQNKLNRIPDENERFKERIKRLHKKKYLKEWNDSSFL